MRFRLRRHHKFLLSVLIVVGIVVILLAIAQDQETLKIQSPYKADDPLFPAYVSALLGTLETGGNRYEVLTNGDQIFPSMLAAINSATRRISLETYIYENGTVGDQFSAAFEAAARRGVQVRMVVDAMGSDKIPKEWRQRLVDAGVKIGDFGQPKWYSLEELNYRTHRKILVTDGHVGFTGGVGLDDHWLGNAQDKDHWRDTMVRIEGPVARLMEGAFNENFIATSPQPVVPIVDPPPYVPPAPDDAAMVVRSSPTGGSNDLKRLYLLTIGAARRTLDITSPYFIIDESSKWALLDAVKRGVKIRVLVEGNLTDAKPVKYASRYAYQEFLDAGIEIYEYQPTMMHAKTIVVDGAWSMFGSANFDNRSLELNDEMNVAVSDPGLASRLLQDFEQDLRRSKKLDPDAWRRRPVLDKAREHFWSYFGEIF
ncbi:MAG TPA: phospholipase D-like domain-containing protein [Vicinamibacterales bacterium]|nr:phospholipase D-like domain-containing protein [Vicinamibacterales bacterium]